MLYLRRRRGAANDATIDLGRPDDLGAAVVPSDHLTGADHIRAEPGSYRGRCATRARALRVSLSRSLSTRPTGHAECTSLDQDGQLDPYSDGCDDYEIYPGWYAARFVITVLTRLFRPPRH